MCRGAQGCAGRFVWRSTMAKARGSYHLYHGRYNQDQAPVHVFASEMLSSLGIPSRSFWRADHFGNYEPALLHHFLTSGRQRRVEP